jgi:site-specific recombinase XerD
MVRTISGSGAVGIESPQALRDYWLLCGDSEGRSPDTIRTYREHTTWFLRHLGDGELNPFSVRGFLADYRKDHAPASLRTVFTSIRAFLRFGVREGLLPESVLTGLRPPKRAEAPKRVYSTGQLTALFKLLEGDHTALGVRDLGLVSVLLDTGLRASETCNLTLAHLQDGALLVGPSKSGRMRLAPLGQKAQRHLYRYLAAGRPRLMPRSEHLFVTQGGLPLNRETIRRILERLSRRVGFRLSAHRFRHSWTTTMLRQGCDLETLRRLGGWADYSMLRTYTHLDDGDLRAAKVRFSPLDRV